MCKRFTDEARRSVETANQKAMKLGQEYIGTEHILLGILEDEECFAFLILKRLDVNIEKVRSEILALVMRGPSTTSPRGLPESPRATILIKNAKSEAQRLGSSYVGTEHMLLAILLDSESIAAQVLTDLAAGLTHEEVESALLEMSAG